MNRKQIIIFTLITILLVYLLLPIFLRHRIEESLQAKFKPEIKFHKLTINTISKFPNWKLSATNITNIDDHNLISATNVFIIFNPFYVVQDTFVIKKLHIESLQVRQIANKAKTSNFIRNNGVIKDQKKLRFDEFQIDNFNYRLEDQKAQLKFEVKNTKLHASSVNSALDLNAQIGNIDLTYDSLRYIHASNLDFKTALLKTAPNTFQIQNKSVQLNNKEIDLEGSFSLAPHLSMNLEFEQSNIHAKSLLSNNKQFSKYLSYIENGNVTILGKIDGTFGPNSMPRFYYQMQFDALELIDSLNQRNHIQIPEATIIAELKSSSVDSIRIRINETKLITNEKVTNLNLAIDKAFSNPQITADLNGQIDLATFALLFPNTGFTYKGSLDLDIKLAGSYKDWQQNNYQNFLSEGNITTSAIKIEHRNWYYPLLVSRSNLRLKNNTLDIQQFNGKYGNSDLHFAGTILNPVDYIFKGDELKATLTLKSSFLNLNQLLAKKYSEDNESPNQAVVTYAQKEKSLPKRLNIKVHTSATKAQFDKMQILNFKGDITLQPAKITLENCNANLLDGSLKLNGNLTTVKQQNLFKGTLDLKRIDFRKSYSQLRIVQKVFPIARHSSGKFSANLTLESPLDDKWNFNAKMIQSKGSIETHNIVIQNNPSFRSLNTVIKMDKIPNITIDDLQANYQYAHEMLTLAPFETKVANQPMKMYGKYQSAGTLDFTIDAKVEKAILVDKIQNMIRFIPGNERIKILDIGMKITGDASKPEIDIDYEKVKQQVMKQIKTSSPKELEDAAKNLLKQLFK